MYLSLTGIGMNCREFSWSIEKSAGQDFRTLKTRVYPQHRFTKTAVKCLFLNQRDFLIPDKRQLAVGCCWLPIVTSFRAVVPSGAYYQIYRIMSLNQWWFDTIHLCQGPVSTGTFFVLFKHVKYVSKMHHTYMYNNGQWGYTSSQNLCLQFWFRFFNIKVR